MLTGGDHFQPVTSYGREKSGFSSIVGHEAQKSYLANAVTGDRISHGYIFEGPEGIGKYATAGAFARMMLCDVGTGCGACPGCHKFDSFNHPDFLTVAREGTSQGILVSQMAAIQDFLSVKPNENGRKVVIVRDAESMNVSSQNKILKVLEEPPHYAVIIFTVNNGMSLLPTVISRCQKVSFFRLSNSDTIEAVGAMRSFDSHGSEALVNFAQGSPGELLKLLDSEEYSSMRESSLKVISHLRERNFTRATAEMGRFARSKDEAMGFLRILVIAYRDVMASTCGRNMEKTIYNIDRKSEIITFSTFFDTQKAVMSIVKIEKAFDYLGSNVSPLLVFDSLAIELQEVLNG